VPSCSGNARFSDLPQSRTTPPALSYPNRIVASPSLDSAGRARPAMTIEQGQAHA
jgi:hypothetical protein